VNGFPHNAQINRAASDRLDSTRDVAAAPVEFFVMRWIGSDSMRRGPTLKTLQKVVDKFNAEYPVGTKVILRKDSGEVDTEVRAPAEVLEGHSAVGWFVGVSGCYSIEDNRVRALVTV